MICLCIDFLCFNKLPERGDGDGIESEFSSSACPNAECESTRPSLRLPASSISTSKNLNNLQK